MAIICSGSDRWNERSVKLNSGVAMSTIRGKNLGVQIAAVSSRLAETEKKSVQQLSWRGFAVRKNVSNRRRKFLNAGTRHDDAITAAVSFLSDTQEPPALILPELDVEMLPLNLQFFRLDDVIHFALRARV